MKWVVFAKPPFGGPEAVLAYLSRYTHRIAISNRRLIALDEAGVTFRYKDYRRHGDARHRTMTLSADEFIRRFLVHVLPKGLHRIRHYGLLASAGRKANLAHARELLCRSSADQDPGACLLREATPVVPLLRRAHDRHRELRGRRPSPRSSLSPMENRMTAS